MTNTYDTSNEPLGSTAVKVLYNNSSNFDEGVNSTELTFVDRFNRLRVTWAGFEQQFSDFLISSGFEPVHLVYTPGMPLTVDRPTQLIDYAGSVYRVKMPSVFPVTLTGVWATDQSKLVDVGDLSLRQFLASSSGSASIGTPRGTVEQDYAATQVSLTQAIDTANAANGNAKYNTFGRDAILSRSRKSVSPGPQGFFFGDSISHGAFGGNLFRNGWVNLMKRMLNAEYNSYSYGFAPMVTLTDPSTGIASVDVHDISSSGAWSDLDTATATYLPQGFALLSTSIGNVLRSRVATFQDFAQVHYVTQPGGGTFSIAINGAVVQNVNTDGPTKNAFSSVLVSLVDNGFGSCEIACTTTSGGRIELSGFSYFDAESQIVMHNYSQSGRKLRNTDESVIAGMLNSNCPLFVSALGFNDALQNDTDDAYYAAFKQRIDWMIQYANANQVPMLVMDFCWYWPATNRTRSELRRLADSTSGSYVPFPDFFKKGAAQGDSAYLKNTLKLFSDGIHPNMEGQTLIAESGAKKLMLGVSTKKQALDYYDWWYPLQLFSGGTVQNSGSSSRLVSATRINGAEILVRINVKGIGAGASLKGIVLAPYPQRSGVAYDIPTNPPLAPKGDGASQGFFIVNAAGISIQAVAANASDTQQIMFSIPRTFHHDLT